MYVFKTRANVDWQFKDFLVLTDVSYAQIGQIFIWISPKLYATQVRFQIRYNQSRMR